MTTENYDEIRLEVLSMLEMLNNVTGHILDFEKKLLELEHPPSGLALDELHRAAGDLEIYLKIDCKNLCGLLSAAQVVHERIHDLRTSTKKA